MDIELMNILNIYFCMCAKSSHFTKEGLIEEIKNVCQEKIILESAENVKEKDIANWIVAHEYMKISDDVWEKVRRNRKKEILKKIIYSV